MKKSEVNANSVEIWKIPHGLKIVFFRPYWYRKKLKVDGQVWQLYI